MFIVWVCLWLKLKFDLFFRYGPLILSLIVVEHVPSPCACLCAPIAFSMAITLATTSTCFDLKLVVPATVATPLSWIPTDFARITSPNVSKNHPRNHYHLLVYYALHGKLYHACSTIWCSSFERTTFQVSVGFASFKSVDFCIFLLADNKKANALLSDVLIYFNDLGSLAQDIVCTNLTNPEIYKNFLNSRCSFSWPFQPFLNSNCLIFSCQQGRWSRVSTSLEEIGWQLSTRRQRNSTV